MDNINKCWMLCAVQTSYYEVYATAACCTWINIFRCFAERAFIQILSECDVCIKFRIGFFRFSFMLSKETFWYLMISSLNALIRKVYSPSVNGLFIG